MGNGVGHVQAFLATAATVDANSNELGGAFTVANNGLGQLEHNRVDCLAELLILGTLRIIDFSHSHLTGGNQHAGVIGAGIAINGNAIE